MVPYKNVGAAIKSKVAGAGRLVAGGAGDAAKVTGVSIDRMPPGAAGYLSCVLAIACEAVLAANKKLLFAVEVQYAADNGSGAPGAFDAAVVLQASTALLTDSGAGSTLQGILEFDLDLSAQKRWVRFNITPDLDAANTDTAHWGATCVLGGASQLPV